MNNQWIDKNGELVIVPLSEADIAQRAIDQAAWEAGASQRERDAHNAPILLQLEANDKRSIRALRDGDDDYLLQLKTEAATLRGQLMSPEPSEPMGGG
jgi:hypothetical protein